jgi:hypothetical protein
MNCILGAINLLDISAMPTLIMIERSHSNGQNKVFGTIHSMFDPLFLAVNQTPRNNSEKAA